MEIGLVSIWLKKDLTRWFAGLLAGIFSGGVALAVASYLSLSYGLDPELPEKLLGTILLGSSATDLNSHQGSLYGLALFEAISAFWGIVFAQMTGTNIIIYLLPMGLTWGAFSWIFTWNLFLHSFKTIQVADISSAAALLICMTYGVCLISVSFFHRLLGAKH